MTTLDSLRKNGFVTLDGGKNWMPGTMAPKHGLDAGVQPVRKARTIRRFIYAQVVSEANQGGKLRKKISRKMAQKRAVCEAFGTELLNAGKPKAVTFVLLTNQPQDDDNFSRSMKVFRDQIARSCGFDDKERVWKYRQEKRRTWEPRGTWITVEF